MWRQAWVNAVDQWDKWWSEPFRLIQNQGRGLISTGTRQWTDYRLSAPIRPAMLKSGGLAVRVQGLRRFYSLLFTADKKLRLLKVVDDQETVLAEETFEWQLWQTYHLSLEVKGERLRAWVEDKLVFEVAILALHFMKVPLVGNRRRYHDGRLGSNRTGLIFHSLHPLR
jgi:hypothetical protein